MGRKKSPADLDELDSAVAEYLKRPWLRHDTIDVSVINALIFTELAIFVEAVKTGQALGKPNWSYLFSGGNLFAQIGLSLTLPVLGFFTAWVMWPAISAGFFAYGYQTAALVTISVWALYVLYRIIILPWRFRARKARKTAAVKANEILVAALKAWQAARGRIINPSRLRDFVVAVEGHGGAFRPVLHTVIDRAIQRDLTRP